MKTLFLPTPSMTTRFGDRPYINFDNAASTPPLRSVLETVTEFSTWYSSVHRGSGLKSQISTQAYEDARHIVMRSFAANEEEYVALFGKNATEALNKLSYRLGLRRTDIVLVSPLEHHSNDLPWRMKATVKHIKMSKNGGVDKEDYLALLERYGTRVKLVALTGASNVTGYRPDIYWFAEKAHAVGAQIVIDCAQRAAHSVTTMRRLEDPRHLDYVVFSGHKLYAPFGSGVLIGRRDTFLEGAPEYVGGGTVDLVTSSQVTWGLLPDKEEAGSPNVIGAVALAKALSSLGDIGFDAIAAHEKELTQHALRRLAAIPGVTLYGSTANDRSPVISFTIAGVPSHLVAAILSHEWNIGVRSGCFCAQPYVMNLLNLSTRTVKKLRQNPKTLPGMVRISFGIYNTIEEIDMCIEAIIAIVQGDYGRYIPTPTGEYYPRAPLKTRRFFSLEGQH